jgi:hypothetical protein
MRSKLLPLALLLLLPLQLVPAMAQKSPTSDELAHHLASGFSHLVKRDFRMNPAMPPLPRYLTAVPMVLLGAKGPWDHPSWEAGNSPEFAREFFYQANRNADQLVFWARVPIVILSMLFGALVWAWAGAMAGFAAALTALLLYVFCPDILAHSQLATSDLSVAFFFTLAFAVFWKYLNGGRKHWLALTGLAAGGAFLSKFTAVLLPPILIFIALAAGKGRLVRPVRVAAAAAVCVVTIWAGYGFEVKPLLQNTPDPLKKEAFIRKAGGERMLSIARNTPLPLTTFASSLGSMVFTRVKGTNAYLMGEWSEGGRGWWYYYFVAFGVKNTLPFLLLIGLAFAAWKVLPLSRVDRAVLIVPVVFFFAVTMPDRAQAGIRYFLPIYPLLMVLAGSVVSRVWAAGPPAVKVPTAALKSLTAALLVWHGVEAVRVFPDHLTYFNQAAGGPAGGYRWLRDSNIDWGQDLKGLGRFVREQGYEEVVLMYYGSADPAYYGIPAVEAVPADYERPRATVYALAVHHIDTMKWFERYKPIRVIGNSIWVYDFRNVIGDIRS